MTRVLVRESTWQACARVAFHLLRGGCRLLRGLGVVQEASSLRGQCAHFQGQGPCPMPTPSSEAVTHDPGAFQVFLDPESSPLCVFSDGKALPLLTKKRVLVPHTHLGGQGPREPLGRPLAASPAVCILFHVTRTTALQGRPCHPFHQMVCQCSMSPHVRVTAVCTQERSRPACPSSGCVLWV